MMTPPMSPSPAVAVDLVDALEDWGVADLAGDLHLVAAGEEDARGAFEDAHLPLFGGLPPLVDAQLEDVPDAEGAEGALVLFEEAVGVGHGDRRHHELARAHPSRHLAEDDLVARAVLAAADDD
jgi:hypothetical protein